MNPSAGAKPRDPGDGNGGAADAIRLQVADGACAAGVDGEQAAVRQRQAALNGQIGAIVGGSAAEGELRGIANLEFAMDDQAETALRRRGDRRLRQRIGARSADTKEASA